MVIDFLIGDYFLEILRRLRENEFMVGVRKVTEITNVHDWFIASLDK